MNRSEPRPPRRAGKAAAIILGIVAAIILVVFLGRNVWHGEALRESQEAGNNVAANYQGPSNY